MSAAPWAARKRSIWAMTSARASGGSGAGGGASLDSSSMRENALPVAKVGQNWTPGRFHCLRSTRMTWAKWPS
ncbi:hypothetical protein ACOBQX_05520 [Actinokineospora sp. G85]|uniref:hypothetical protein n=1 Tax=Actinokineospora sp. G85 TaxID=3406626 RepID=UPI003C71780D